MLKLFSYLLPSLKCNLLGLALYRLYCTGSVPAILFIVICGLVGICSARDEMYKPPYGLPASANGTSYINLPIPAGPTSVGYSYVRLPGVPATPLNCVLGRRKSNIWGVNPLAPEVVSSNAFTIPISPDVLPPEVNSPKPVGLLPMIGTWPWTPPKVECLNPSVPRPIFPPPAKDSILNCDSSIGWFWTNPSGNNGVV